MTRSALWHKKHKIKRETHLTYIKLNYGTPRYPHLRSQDGPCKFRQFYYIFRPNRNKKKRSLKLDKFYRFISTASLGPHN